MAHLEDDLVLRYVNGLASDMEQYRIEDHLSRCDACFDRIRTLLYLRENFDSLWDSWTVSEMNFLFREKRLLQTLKAVTDSGLPQAAEKARKWLNELKEGTLVTLGILVDRSERLASAAASVLPSGYQFALQASGGVGAAEDLRRLEAHQQRGSDLLSSDETEAAREELRQAAKISPRRAQAVISEVYAEGTKKMEVIADSQRGVISVKFWAFGEEPLPELVLLLRGEGEPPLISEFEGVEGESYFLAEFHDVPSDRFEAIVRVTPVQEM